MPIGSKIRLGSGNTPFEIVAKNHSGYPDNSVTLWTPYSLQTTTFGSGIDYRQSTVKTLCTNLYNTFSAREKEFVIITDLPTCVTNTGSVVTLQDYVFLFSGKELGGSGVTGGDTGCTSFNFTTEQKKARAKLSNGNWTSASYGYFWSRSAYVNSSSSWAVWLGLRTSVVCTTTIRRTVLGLRLLAT